MHNPADAEKILHMMADKKIVQLDGNKFRINPSFIPILRTQLSNQPGPHGLIMAIHQYVPEATPTEIALYCGGFMQILHMENSPLYHEIIATLDRDIPVQPWMKQKGLDDIFQEIESEKKNQENRKPCSCGNCYCLFGSDTCLNCGGWIDRSDLM